MLSRHILAKKVLEVSVKFGSSVPDVAGVARVGAFPGQSTQITCIENLEAADERSQEGAERCTNPCIFDCSPVEATSSLLSSKPEASFLAA